MDWVVDWELLGRGAIRLLLASVCGAVIGWEREFHKKGAGLRTHMLICSGACLFTLAALEMKAQVGGDLLRLVQGLTIGIGFIGSGVIFTQGASTKGLTTAAGLWVACAIGLVAGMGYKELALLGTLFVLVIITALKRAELRLETKGPKPDDDETD
jgi:putative Mg2+ transporter-C (MgtC) family protein